MLAAALGAMALLGVTASPAQADCPETECTAPTDLHGVSSTQVKITVAWTAVENATGYRLQYSRSSDFSSDVHGARTTGTEYAVRSLLPATKYYFRVAVSTDTARVSPWSETVKYWTKEYFAARVGTYNIKNPDSDDWPLWSERGRRSAEAIVSQGVKLLGVQELYGYDDRRRMVKYLNEKAGGEYYAMVPPPDSSTGKDSRILYDQRVFQHKTSGGTIFSYQDSGESRNYTWGKFVHIPSGRDVLFVTTHLAPSNDDADREQWREILSYAERVLRDSGKPFKVIMAGDYNVSKFEEIGADMFAETRNRGFDDVLGQQYRSYDTYRNPTTRVDAWISTSNRGERDITRYSVSPDRNGNGIDHVFISSALKVPYYRVYAQPRTGNIMDYLMSDHFLVIAKVAE